MCWNLFLGLQLYYKETPTKVIAKLFRNTFFTKHLRTTATEVCPKLTIKRPDRQHWNLF